MESKELKALNNVYLEAVYGQSAGQELAKREKDDDAAGAPRAKMRLYDCEQSAQEDIIDSGQEEEYTSKEKSFKDKFNQFKFS